MNDNLHDQIYRNLVSKENDELLEIWKRNDRIEWSDTTFEVIEEILRTRNIEIPLQDHINQDKVDEEIDDNLEEWENKLIDNENQPDFYDTLEVISLNKNIKLTAKAYVVITAGVALFRLRFIPMMFIGGFPPNGEIVTIFFTVSSVVLETGVSIFIMYFMLKATTQILRMLMEMEFNSRGAKNN